MATGKLISVANTTLGLITLKYRGQRSGRMVKYRCIPGEVTEIPESHFTMLKKNIVVAGMLKEKKIVVGKNTTPQPNLPDGFEEDESLEDEQLDNEQLDGEEAEGEEGEDQAE